MAKHQRRVGGPAWTPGERTLTVGEIAERLAAIAPDIAGTVQKIRHWTREQMLLPVDQLHAGTGKHRRYAADAVYDAALLHVLTGAGLNVSSQRYLVDALTQTRFALEGWKLATQRGAYAPLYLFIWRTVGGVSLTEVSENPHAVPRDCRSFKADDVAFTISVDLARLFSRLGK